jgi:hypothetical protein
MDIWNYGRSVIICEVGVKKKVKKAQTRIATDLHGKEVNK